MASDESWCHDYSVISRANFAGFDGTLEQAKVPWLISAEGAHKHRAEHA